MQSATVVPPLMERNPNTGNLFDPEKTVFNSISDIPGDLLTEVAQCFQKRMLICRICYFESHCKELSSKKTTRNTCEKGHAWKPVRVVPSCSLCISPSTFISILPLPKHMKHCNSPFQVCKKTDHQTCFFMSKNTNPWFPHTVEELVIWTVEREKGALCRWMWIHWPFPVLVTLVTGFLQNPCNTVFDLGVQCLPYMEDSELNAFLIWKIQSSVPSLYGRFRSQSLPNMEVQSSVPSLYGRFRAQCLPYMEDSDLSAFLIWKIPSSVPSLYGRFRA